MIFLSYLLDWQNAGILNKSPPLLINTPIQDVVGNFTTAFGQRPSQHK